MKLHELLKDFDWGWYDEDAPTAHAQNTTTVRVYFGPIAKTDSYCEIGRCTAYNRKECTLKDFLREDVLNMDVGRYYVDDYLHILCVHLKGKDDKLKNA